MVYTYDEEFDMAQKYFDSNGDGVISFGEFMKSIEGDQGKMFAAGCICKYSIHTSRKILEAQVVKEVIQENTFSKSGLLMNK